MQNPLTGSTLSVIFCDVTNRAEKRKMKKEKTDKDLAFMTLV
jgi:hypothetical protein